jgi:type II secretory pathway pseudopilin PulG
MRASISRLARELLQMKPRLATVEKTRLGLSTIELLLVIGMVSVIAVFAVISLFRPNRSAYRTNIAVEIANHLQNARIDSIHRKAKTVNQMGQVRIIDRRTYSIVIDGNNDGYLDYPVVMNLPEELGVEFSEPFPKTFVFDGYGETVDLEANPIKPQPMILEDSSGSTAIKISDDGKITVVPTGKLTAAR